MSGDTGTRPSDRALRDFVGYRMKRAFNAVQADVNAVLRPFGLRMVTFSALTLIGAREGMRQSALAELLAIEPPNLVILLDELEKAGLIRRQRAASDRRAHELVMTDAGRALRAKAHAAVTAHDTAMTEGLTEDERAALVRALTIIEANGKR